MWPEDKSYCVCAHKLSAHTNNGNGYCTECKVCFVSRRVVILEADVLDERRTMFELGRICDEIQNSGNES